MKINKIIFNLNKVVRNEYYSYVDNYDEYYTKIDTLMKEFYKNHTFESFNLFDDELHGTFVIKFNPFVEDLLKDYKDEFSKILIENDIPIFKKDKYNIYVRYKYPLK